jgi:hypothetical protein
MTEAENNLDLTREFVVLHRAQHFLKRFIQKARHYSIELQLPGRPAHFDNISSLNPYIISNALEY